MAIASSDGSRRLGAQVESEDKLFLPLERQHHLHHHNPKSLSSLPTSQASPFCSLPPLTTYAQAKGLDDLFDEIVTNPAEWDESGLLKLRRRIDPSGPQHGCQVGYSPNMCKGQCAACGHGDPNVMLWQSITGICIRAVVDWPIFFSARPLYR